MAWGVELWVENTGGGKLDRIGVGRRSSKATPDDSDEPAADWRYLLNTTVPDYWFPLMPKRIKGQHGCTYFELGQAPASDIYGVPTQSVPLGRILKGLRGEASFLREEELPREGFEVTRSYKTARWINGQSYTWIGRRKKPGRGEGSSGLRWDVVREA